MAETDDPTADKGLINGAIRSVSLDADGDGDAATGADDLSGDNDERTADAIAEGPDVADRLGDVDDVDGVDDADEQGEFVVDDFEIEYPANEGAPPPSAARRGAVASAFLGAGLALEQVIYGEKRSIPAVVQEADDPLDDGDFDLHLDPDNPADSWARLRTKDETPVDSAAGDTGG